MADLETDKRQAESLLAKLGGQQTVPQEGVPNVEQQVAPVEEPVEQPEPVSSGLSTDLFSDMAEVSDIQNVEQSSPAVSEPISGEQSQLSTSGLSADAFADMAEIYQEDPTETVGEMAAAEQYVDAQGGVEEPSSLTDIPQNLLNKDTLTVEDIRDLPFEQIVAMADVSSPLKFSAKEQLSEALRGSTTTGGVGEFFLGTPFSSDELEGLLEEKYQDYIQRNPEQERGVLGRAVSALATGSPINNLVSEESQTLLPQSVAEINAIAQGATGRFGDDIYEALGMSNTARAIDSSIQQLSENDIAGDAVVAELLGAALPSGRAAQALGIGGRGVSTLGNVARGAGLGAAESAIFAAGGEDGNVSERLEAAAEAAPVGAALGAAGPVLGRAIGAAGRGIGGLFSRQIRQNSSVNRALNRVSSTIDNIPNSDISVSPDEIVENLSQGIPLQTLLADRGMSGESITRVLNSLPAGSRELFNTIETTGRELIRTRAAQNADQLSQIGQRLEIARGRTSPSDISNIIKDTMDLDQGGVFEEEILYPAIRQLAKARRNTIASRAGYTRSNARNLQVHAKPDGTIYVVKPDENGVPFRANRDGTYSDDQLYEIKPTGSLITDLESRTAQIINPDASAGAARNQTVAYSDYDPIRQNLRSGERRASPEAASLADQDRMTRLEGRAGEAGSRGPKSKDDFLSELQRTTGELADLTSEQRQSLEKIAEEMSGLAGAGSRDASRTILPAGIQRFISDVRVAGLFSGSLSGASRVLILNQVVNAIRNAMGSDVSLTVAEEVLEPVVRALIRADDAQVVGIIRNAAESGATTNEALAQSITASLPVLFEQSQSPQDLPDDALFNDLGAQ